MRSCLSMGDMAGGATSRRRVEGDRRNMRFSTTVHVCLVPTRQELETVMDCLYFTAEDFSQFKKDAVFELREVITRFGIGSKQAIKLMYVNM